MSKEKYPIIFDLDGTLFNCKELTNQTFPQSLRILESRHQNEIEIQYFPNYEQFLGTITSDIFAQLLPNADENLIKEAEQILIDIEMELIPEFGTLFEGVKKTLKDLHEDGYPLFIASNGSKEYVNKVVEVFSLRKYFSGIFSAGEQETESKVELVKLLLRSNSFEGKGVMIGDRHSDIEAGMSNQLITVGCQYGYGDNGEIKLADVKIQGIEELIPFIKKLSEKDSV